MGTRFELALFGRETSHLRAAGEEAIAEIQHWHDRLNLFDRASTTSLINREARYSPVGVDHEFLSFLIICRQLWSDTDGSFDPALGSLMHAAGFRDQPRSEAALTSLRSQAGFAHVVIDEQRATVTFSSEHVQLDFGAIAKGWALDRAADILSSAGVTHAILHGGTSSVRALNAPTDPPFHIRLSHASRSPQLALHAAALSASAPHSRTTLGHGHVLDPVTGQSAQTSFAAAVHSSATVAEAWSTALLVRGHRPANTPADLTSIIQQSHDRAWDIKGPHTHQTTESTE